MRSQIAVPRASRRRLASGHSGRRPQARVGVIPQRHTDGCDEAREPLKEPAPRGGPVIVDVGGDIGALIIRLDDELEGTELPIEFALEPSRDIHTGVWSRSTGRGSAVVAVYPELREGSYQVRPSESHGGAEIEVVGGHVVHVDLRRSAGPSA